MPTNRSINFDQALAILKDPRATAVQKADALKYMSLLGQALEGNPAPPAPSEPRTPAVTGVSRRQLPAPAVTGAEPDWEKEAAKMKSCKGYNEIYAAVASFMNGQDDNFANIYCRYCPDTLFKRVAVRQDNGHLTKDFCAKKQTLAKHLQLSSHATNWRACKGMGKEAVKKSNIQAMYNCGSLVLAMIHAGDSFNSYPMRITLLIDMGVNTGFQNHSTQAPPKWVDIFYRVAIKRLGQQLSTPLHFCGEYRSLCTPFSVSVDKDTVKHVPKQVTGLKFADFSSPDLNLADRLKMPPFIQFLYLGHPTAIDTDGPALAELVFTTLEKCGVTTLSMKNCVGMCGDGQYLHNNVVTHIERQHSILGLFNVWDFAHMVELQWDSALALCPLASEIVDTVNDVIRDLANSWYKSYAAVCLEMKLKFLQPSALKKLKFIGNVEQQFTKFGKMFEAIHVVAQRKEVELRPKRSNEQENDQSAELLSAEEIKKKEDRKDAQQEIKVKRAKLVKINKRLDHKDFLPQLALTNNVIQFVSKFSLAGQNKHLTIGEYVNLVDLYKLALTNLDFRTFPSSTMLYHLKEFFDHCEKGVPGYYAPGESRTRSERKKDKVDQQQITTEDLETRMKRIMEIGEDLREALLQKHAEYWWIGGPNTLYQKRRGDVPLIKNAARLINYIAGHHVKLTPDIKGVNVPMFKCLTCTKHFTSKHHDSGEKCKGTTWEEVEELVPGFALSLPVNYDIQHLEHLVIAPWRDQLTRSQIERVRNVFKEICDEIRPKAVPTLDMAARSLFTCTQYWNRCQPGPLLLFLKCLTACASEAIIETYGSVMEKLYKRYTGYTKDDDARCQKEMFVKMATPTVPITPAWKSIMKESIDEYLHVYPGSTFAHEGKVVNRMPITSKTAEQLMAGELLNRNRVAGIYRG